MPVRRPDCAASALNQSGAMEPHCTQRRWRWSDRRSGSRHVDVVGVVILALALMLEEAEAQAKGTWTLVTSNAGISAMHAAVTPVVGSVVLLHHSNSGPSNITFPG